MIVSLGRLVLCLSACKLSAPERIEAMAPPAQAKPVVVQAAPKKAMAVPCSSSGTSYSGCSGEAGLGVG